MGGAPGPALVEREEELLALRAAAQAAAAGAGAVVVVRGAPGIGKSALLDQGARAAQAARLRVVRASGSEITGGLPFATAAELLGPTLRSVPARARERLLAGSGRLARSLLTGEAPLAPEAAAGRMQLVHALSWVVVGLAEERPLALVVDDEHWVDDSSAALLGYLARRAADLPLLLLVAGRPVQQPGRTPLDGVPGVAARLLRPRPLSTAGVAAVVGRLLPAAGEDVLAACAQVTGGNPLLVGELLDALRLEPGPPDAERVRRIGPEPVARAIEGRLRLLPAGAGALVRALCVLGDGAELGLVVALSGLQEEPARAALAALERSGLVLGGTTVGLAHPLQRQALRATMSASELAFTHRDAARLLARRGDDPEAGAHLLLAPARAEGWAVDALVHAGRSALERGAPADAVRLLERARLEPPEPAQVPGVLGAIARARAAAGDPEAADAMRVAIDQTPDAGDRARLLVALAAVHQAQGRFEDVVHTAQEGLTLPVSEGLRVELTALHDGALTWAPGGPADDRRLGSTELPATVRGRTDRLRLATAARDQLLRGEPDHAQAAQLALAAWDDGALLRDAGCDDPALPRILTVLHNSDELADALRVCDAALQDAGRRGSPMGHAVWRHLRGHVLQYLGRLPEAEEELLEAFDARLDGWGALLPVTIAALTQIRIERDDLAGAAEVLDAAQDVTTTPHSSPMWATTQAARGQLLLERREHEEALDVLLEAGRRFAQELGTTNPAASPWRSDAVEAARRLGRTGLALELAETDLAAARRWGAPRALGRTLRVRASLLAPEDRLVLLQEAVAVLRPSQARLEHAHAEVALGELQRAASPQLARETLRGGLDLAETCGALRLADRAEEALRSVGARPRRRRLQGPTSLTTGERRVVALAVAGRSNRQIAEELFVTPKAVAFHLGNAYRKLGVPGRADLAGALEHLSL